MTSKRIMERVLALAGVVILAFTLAGCTGRDEPGKEKGPPGPAGGRPESGDAVLIRVGPKEITEGSFYTMMGADEFRHQFMGGGGVDQEVRRAVETKVRELLVTLDIEENFQDDPRYGNLREYLEDEQLYDTYLRKNLTAAVGVTPEEVEGEVPTRWVEVKLRAVTLATWEEAREVLERIEKGEDFISLIREFDTRMFPYEDGLFPGYMTEGAHQFFKDDVDHLLSLKKGEYSRIMPSQLGVFFICRAEDVRPIPEERKNSLIAEIRNNIFSRKVGNLIGAVREEVTVKPLDWTEFTTRAQLFLEGDSTLDRSVVFETRDRELLMSTVMYMTKTTNLSYQENLPFYVKISLFWNKAGTMAGAIAGAHAARLAGTAISPESDPAFKAQRDMHIRSFHFQKVIGSIEVDREEAREFFDKNQEVFFGRGSVELYSVVTGMQKRADKAREMLLAGADFGEVARKYSIDSDSREKGGSLGVIPLSNLDPELARALSGLTEGEISPVVETRAGFYVAKVARRIPPKRSAFEVMEKQVIEKYRKVKTDRVRQEYLMGLKERHGVEVDWDGVRRIVERLKEESDPSRPH